VFAESEAKLKEKEDDNIQHYNEEGDLVLP
jgi:hypothetical protein